MPVVQPAELWQETGRWGKYGPELLRLKDRHERDFVIQPTSEEVITDIARKDLRSYKQLPINFYHIQTKFRDEIRPRFGVMRAREFVMKDAYSFDVDPTAMLKSLPGDVRRLRAHLHAHGPHVPRRRRRHGPDRRQRVARIPGARGLRRGRDRLVSARPTTRPTSSSPRRSRPAPSRAARRGADAEGADARQGNLRGRRASSSACRSQRTVKCIMLATDAEGSRAQSGCC